MYNAEDRKLGAAKMGTLGRSSCEMSSTVIFTQSWDVVEYRQETHLAKKKHKKTQLLCE